MRETGCDAAKLLRLAASVDRLSAHVLGEALVATAKQAGQELTMPADVHEDPGQGIAGTVDGHRVLVGSRAFMRTLRRPASEICFREPCDHERLGRGARRWSASTVTSPA